MGIASPQKKCDIQASDVRYQVSGPIPDSRFPIPDFRFPIPDMRKLFVVLGILLSVGTWTPAYPPDVVVKDDLTEQQAMDLLLELMVNNARWVETQFVDTSHLYPNTGYFCNAGDAANQGNRTNNNYALMYALLYKELPDDQYPLDGPYKQNLKEKAVKAIRFAIFTHDSNGVNIADKPWVTTHWQSSFYTGPLLLAAHFLWDSLDDEAKAAALNLAVAQGDKAVNRPPGSYLVGNTQAEENAWDTNGPSIASNLFPDHPNAAAWREAAIKYAMTAVARKADWQDTTLVDGRPANEWFEGKWNIFDDYSLENHNMFHPMYLESPAKCISASVAHFAYFGNEVPDGFKYNIDKIYRNGLAAVTLPTGQWAFPQGCDWQLLLMCQSAALAYQAIMFQDEGARLMETRLLQLAIERQKDSGDGRLVRDGDASVYGREGAEMEGLLTAYLLHRYLGDWPEQTTIKNWNDFVNKYDKVFSFMNGEVLTRQNQNRFSSISWGSPTNTRFFGHIIPNSDGYLHEGYVTHPNLPNVFGQVGVNGAIAAKTAGEHVETISGDSFSSVGYVNEGTALRRYVAMTSLPDNAVVLMDVLRATGDANVTVNDVLPLSFQTDRTTGLKKKIETSDNAVETFDAGPELEVGTVNKVYIGDWVRVDDHTSVILDKSRTIRFGNRVKSSQIFGSTLKFGAETGNFSAADTVSKAVNVVLSNVGKPEMLAVKNSIKPIVMPNGWLGLLLKDTDGREYFIVNNFYGEDGTGTFHYTGPFGTPVILQHSSIDGNGDCTLELAEGPTATYYAPLDKWVKVNGTGVIRVINCENESKFCLRNDGGATVSVDITFTKNGAVVGRKTGILVASGACYEISLIDGNTVKATRVPF
ncbi:MAG: hypothetical protein FWC43_07670 [Planctomycetaceae bacterium]|nr:hypothetical protein [Planctomycetaceae bacterium]